MGSSSPNRDEHFKKIELPPPRTSSNVQKFQDLIHGTHETSEGFVFKQNV